MAQKITAFEPIGQDVAIKRWSRLIHSGRLGHAHLLTGNAGVGKDALAFWIAAAVNCQKEGTGVCGECSSCHKMKSLEHPALHLVFAMPRKSASKTDPLKGMSEDDIELINDQLAMKAAWPYHRLSIPDANDIRISSIRKLRTEIYLGGDPGATKVIIILRAHQMNIEAVNALLKILEEPPPDCLFLLTTEYPDRLPDTIRSRCQVHQVPDISWRVVANHLMKSRNITPESAEASARLANGNLALAHHYAEEDTSVWLDRTRAALNALARQDFLSVYRLVQELKDKNIYDDHSRQQFLSLLILFFRDVAIGLDDDSGSLWQAEVAKVKALFPDFDAHAAIATLERTKDALERKVHLPLAIMSLFFTLRQNLKGVVVS